MSEFVLYVFDIIEIQENRFQCVVMHVSIVKERRNIVSWKSTPARARDAVIFGENRAGLKRIARYSRIFPYNSYRIRLCLS